MNDIIFYIGCGMFLVAVAAMALCDIRLHMLRDKNDRQLLKLERMIETEDISEEERREARYFVEYSRKMLKEMRNSQDRW